MKPTRARMLIEGDQTHAESSSAERLDESSTELISASPTMPTRLRSITLLLSEESRRPRLTSTFEKSSSVCLKCGNEAVLCLACSNDIVRDHLVAFRQARLNGSTNILNVSCVAWQSTAQCLNAAFVF